MSRLRGLAALLTAGLSAVALAGPILLAGPAGAAPGLPAGHDSPTELSPASVGADGLLGVAVAVPITVPPASGGLLTVAELTDFTSETGILTRQLDAVTGRTVALGIDPRIIASIRVLGGDAPESATAWLDRLQGLENETFALGYADADPVVGIQAGSPAAIGPTGFGFALQPERFAAADDTADSGDADDPTGSPTPTPTADPDALPPLPQSADDVTAWDYSLDGIAWPGDSTVVTADLPALAGNGYEHVVLGSTNAGGITGPRVSFSTAPLDGLVSDDALSALLRDAVSAPTEVEAVGTASRLTAGLSSAAAAPDGALRVITLARDWPLGPYRLDTALDTIAASGIARLAPLSEALASDPVPTSLVDSPEDATRVAAVAAAFSAAASESSFATVAVEPSLILDDRRLDLLALLSVGWQYDDFWPSAAKAFLDESATMLDAVQITQSSDLFALGRSAPLPVTVRNDLDVPIRVDITATVLRPILSIKPSDLPVTLEVPAKSSAIGKISAEALTNGKVAVDVTLRSSSGVEIGEPSRISLDVHAEWETIGTLAAVVIVVGIFGIGLFRRIRKGRRERREQLEAESP